MNKGNDTIQFEYRYEIDEIISALEIFQKEHPTAKEKETTERLKALLEVMYMEW